MQKISAFLWFDTQAEEAAKFYTSIFKNSRIVETSYYTEAGPGPRGSPMVVAFEIEGQRFHALNGGPHFKFNESISFAVDCENQREVDYFTEMLTAGGGKQQPCGWVKDKYGVSWQVVPKELIAMMNDKDQSKAARAVKAMLQMTKIDIATVKKAFDGR
ncbi:MAG TPA: VOC family protein [Bdellovibrionales bacterium]|nr:VOC family protein [Bdellovibrionales bacterium]